MRNLSVLCVLVLSSLTAQAVSAQGLIWKLPQEENVSISYTGTYTQKQAPAPNTPEEPPIVWTRELEVRILNDDKGYYDGQEVDCRWMEISVRTGEFNANRNPKIDAGPAGFRIYRILVPKAAIVGKTNDSDTIFVSMLPIAKTKDGKVRGIRKIGNGRTEWIKAPVLQVYPILTLLHHYRGLTEKAGGASFSVDERRQGQTEYTKKSITSAQYKVYTASRTIESRTRRSTNTATITRADAIPTGLLSWEVTVVHESKDSSQSRKLFKKETEITAKMKVLKISIGDATSKLPFPKQKP